jgi:hypothetical protein
MPTNRTPIARNRIARFTPQVLDAFRRMRQIEDDPSPEADQEWRRLNGLLCDALALPPWRDPAVEKPGTTLDKPRWKSDPEAVRLYCELERATTLS